ncbi:MAG: response regulator [Planctomycetota bacterium]
MSAASANILLVEDDASVRLAFRVRLTAHGYHVDAAPDGETARQHLSANIPDLVVLDLGLPDCSGTELLRLVRDNPKTSDTPVVIVSGRDMAHESAGLLKQGATACLQKPGSGRQFIELVQELLKSGHQQQTEN